MATQEGTQAVSKARLFSVGKRRIPADEFAVAVLNDKTVIDINHACLEQLEQASKKRFPPIKAEDHLYPFTMTESTPKYTAVEVRAIVLLRLITFLQGRAFVRREIAEFLGDLVTNNIVFDLPTLDVATDQQIMSVFVDTIANNEAFKQACSKANITVPELTPLEISKFTLGITVSQALLILGAYTSRISTKLADASGALSCEVISAFTEPFLQAHYDIAHPYTSAIDTASTIRWMLDSSMLANKSKRKTADPGAFRYIPMTNGAFRDAVAAATYTARIDLNSAEASSGPNEWQHDPALQLQYINQASQTLAYSGYEVVTSVVQRLTHIVSNPEEFGPFSMTNVDETVASIQSVITKLQTELDSIKTNTNNIVAKGYAVAKLVYNALILESAVTSQILRVRNQMAINASLKAQEAKKAALEQRIAKLLEEGKTELAETMRTSALKAKEKEKEKGGADAQLKGLTLGKGTSVYYNAYPSSATGTIEEAITKAQSTCTPLNQEFMDDLVKAVTAVNQSFMPKLPKGTRDSTPQLMAVREKAFNTITRIFQKHGGVGIDTPVFERRETLMGKYGEDSKLIYDLADQGGEILSLRYDLTVPFARYCAANGVTNIKRYHIAKVYRRDQPIMNRGRFREFFQCDYDVAGVYPPMIADSEALKVMSEILSNVNVGPFSIKLNHRKLLDAILMICGVPEDKLRPICSAVDKLDKEPWSVVKDEMVNEKGLAEESADMLEKYVTLPGGNPYDVMAILKKDEKLMAHPLAKEAFADFDLLFTYLDAMKALQYISLDMSLARGLDYYTGIIYEAVLLDKKYGVGSIAAGGRYDNLVGMFSGKHVPAVGISIGFERILAILEQRELEAKGYIKSTKTQILVASVGNNLLVERMKICQELWDLNVCAEFLYSENPTIRKQMEYAFENNIPIVAWIGEDEIKNNVVSVKILTENKDDQIEAVTVPRNELAKYVTETLAKTKSDF